MSPVEFQSYMQSLYGEKIEELNIEEMYQLHLKSFDNTQYKKTEEFIYNDEHFNNLKQISNRLGFIYEDFRRFKFRCNKKYIYNLDMIISKYINEHKLTNLHKECDRLNISRTTIYRFRKNNSHLELEQIIPEYIRSRSFSSKCKELGIKPDTACAYRRNHPELTDEQVIQHYISDTEHEESFKELCKDESINYSTAYSYKVNHPELTNEQVIQHCKNNIRRYTSRTTVNRITRNSDKNEYIRECCKKLGLNCNTVCMFKNRNPELTDEQVIIHYRPDLYINIFGELVIPD